MGGSWAFAAAVLFALAGQGLLPSPAMAIVRDTPLVDHWVVILSVRPDALTVADPIEGVLDLAKDEFLSTWRNALVMVRKRT